VQDGAAHRDSDEVVAPEQQRVRGGQGSGDAAQAAVADQHRRQPQRPPRVALRRAWSRAQPQRRFGMTLQGCM